MTHAARLDTSVDYMNAYESLRGFLLDDLAALDKAIERELRSSVSLVPELSKYIISAGGKRLRPLLTLAFAKLFGYEGASHVTLATSVEFIHTATLLHDDVVDGSLERRGQAAAHTVWGNKASVLVGDFLFSRAFKLLSEVKSTEIWDVMSSCTTEMAEGEVLQLTHAYDLKMGRDVYRKIINCKTAALFEGATKVGAILSGRSQAEIEAVGSYGRNLGFVFQLIDDLIDYRSKTSEMGKGQGDDLREGKITLPVLLAYEVATPDERAFWERIFDHQEVQEGDLEKAVDTMQSHQVFEQIIHMAHEYGVKAKASLEALPAHPMKQGLSDMIDYCIYRSL